jgi:hypothetical protein
MFWNQVTTNQTPAKCFWIKTHQTPEKCFVIKTQYIKQLRNVLESKHNISNIWEMSWNQITTHQTPEKCFGIKKHNISKTWEMFWNQNTTHQTQEKCFWIRIQYTESLRNVLESKNNNQTTKKCFGIKTQHIKQLITKHLSHEERSKHTPCRRGVTSRKTRIFTLNSQFKRFSKLCVQQTRSSEQNLRHPFSFKCFGDYENEQMINYTA